MNYMTSSLVKRWPLLLLVFVVTSLDCPAVHAQNSADSATSDLQASNTAASGGQASEGSSENKSDDEKFKTALNLFQHDWWGRFGRAFEYDFLRIEQPTAFVTATGTTVSNPEHYLNEHTLKFQFSELFPSSSALADAVKNACSLLNSSSGKCPPDNRRFRWIASGGGAWRRAASGFTVNVDLSERPALQQGIVAANTSFTDHYQVTGGFDFDPTQLFLGGTNWSKAHDTMSSKTVDNPEQNELYDSCNKENKADIAAREKCIHDLSSPRLFSGKEGNLILGHRKPMLVIAAVVPTVSFKRVSQFDFVKNGGILVPASFLERAQNQFVFKWDLKKAISPSASRTALMPGPNAKQQPEQAQQQQQGEGKLCVIISGSVRSYIGVSPHFPATSCGDFAASTGSRYLLGCVTDSGISVEADRPSSALPDIDTESCWRSIPMVQERPR
jgi:hypothetical protein